MAKVTKTINQVPEQGIVIQKLDIRPVARTSQDIDKWRAALQAAEAINQNRVQLYDLYEDILLDGTLKNLVEKRILGVTKTKLRFANKNGEPVEAMDELLKSSSFRTLRKEIQKQKAYGISVIELGKKQERLHVYSVPRKHIQSKSGTITTQQYDFGNGISYLNPPISNYVFQVGAYDDLGYLLQAAQYVIYKRGGFGDWAQFAQLFGMPFREARYDGFNETVRLQLIKTLEEMGSAGFAVLPKEAELTLHEAKNSNGSANLYDLLRQACNQEMSVRILGQTETTTKTAGKLGGNDDTHEQTEDDINADDKLDELSVLNEKVIPILLNLGYPAEGEFMYEPEVEKLSIKEMVEVTVKVKKELQLPVEDDYIYELTGIPKPASYNAIKREMAAEKQAQQSQQQQQPTKPPNNPKAPAKKEAEANLSRWDKFQMILSDFFAQAPKD
jgi:hypothetical protein